MRLHLQEKKADEKKADEKKTEEKKCEKGDDCLICSSNNEGGLCPNSFNHPSGYSLVMQGDGNLVIYNDAGEPTWATDTDGEGATKYIMQNDGNLVLYKTNDKAVWDSYGDYPLDTSKAPYGLYMNGDGELSIKDKNNNIVW